MKTIALFLVAFAAMAAMGEAEPFLPWTTSNRLGEAVVKGRDCLYQVGGGNMRGINQIVRIELGADGFPTGRATPQGEIHSGVDLTGCAAAIIGKWLYVAPTGDLPGTIRFEIRDDGALTNRTVLAKTFPERVKSPGMVASGKWLIVMGGWQSRQVFVAEVLADGDVSAWRKIRPLPTLSFCGGKAFRLGKRLYISGWSVFRSPTDRIYSAEVDETGLPVKWSRFAELPGKLTDYAFRPVDESTVMVADNETGEVHVSTLDAAGEFGAWTTCAGRIPDGPFLVWSFEPLSVHHALRLVGLTDEPRTFLPSELVKLDSPADEDCR